MPELDIEQEKRPFILNGVDDDPALRPQYIKDFVGQVRARRELEICINGAKNRNEVLGHVLFYGPPGLGKTTLAKIVAQECGGNFHEMPAPMIARPGDLAGILVSLQPGDVLFIDEIHRLSPLVEEVLYSAMEDFKLSIMTGDPTRPTPIVLDLPQFTLVGATTRSGMLTRPLRDRFLISIKLELYPEDELASVIRRSANLLSTNLEKDVDSDIARRSRGTPRIANKLLKRVRDFIPQSSDLITKKVTQEAFDLLRVNKDGLDSLDQRYLDLLQNRYAGRSVGLKTIAAALGEDQGTLENEVEPWLLMKGFIDRTPRGRTIGINRFEGIDPLQQNLFG